MYDIVHSTKCENMLKLGGIVNSKIYLTKIKYKYTKC